MARKLTQKAQEKAALLKTVEALPKTGQRDEMKALDTEGATPTLTLGGILLLRRLEAEGKTEEIGQDNIAFLQLWVSQESKTKKARKALAKITRGPIPGIVEAFDEWLFTTDLAAIGDDLVTMGQALGVVAENGAILEAAGGENLDDDGDSPNVPG